MGALCGTRGWRAILASTLWTVFLPLSTVVAQKVATPTLNYPTGRYDHPLSVTLRCGTPGASIHYTTDGSTPDATSPLYRGVPILVARHATGDSLTGATDNDPAPDDSAAILTYTSMTLKAVAIKPGMEASDVAEATYVLDLVDGFFNIPYADPPPAGGGKHLLDVYQPHGRTGTPVLLFIHGGAWKQGDKNIYVELGNTFAGYYNVTTVIANYQLSTDPWNAKHPTHIQDVAMAFHWVRQHIGEYGGDSFRISIFGQSAGGHLVSLLATDTTYLHQVGESVDAIKRVISMSGAYDLPALVKWPVNPLGLSAQEVVEYKVLCANAFGSWDQEVLAGASPIAFVHQDQPPFSLITLETTASFHDMPGFPEEAREFYDAILGLNGPAVQLDLLREEDIPPEIAALDFPGDTDGHYQEIYAINTANWDSRSTRMVAGYLDVVPGAPGLLSPAPEAAGDSSVTFVWCRSLLATWYRLQVASSSEFDEGHTLFDASLADTTWTLAGLPTGARLFWRVSAASAAGESGFSPARAFSVGSAAAVTQRGTPQPQGWSLSLQPNPFRNAVNIVVLAPGRARGRVTVYDVLGRVVYRTLASLKPGANRLSWRPRTGLASGVYFVDVAFGSFRATRRVIWLGGM